MLHKETLDSLHVLIPLIKTRNKNDKILYSPNSLISYSNTRNKKMTSSTTSFF